jgi:futalosine hydrolase
MNLLITAATFREIKPLIEYVIGAQVDSFKEYSVKFYGLNIDFLITGVGIPSTIYKLTLALSKKHYDFAVNLGLCGSFASADILIGQTVNITVEQFGDLGINDNGQFKTLFEVGLADPNQFPFDLGLLKNPNLYPEIELMVDHSNVHSITVCTSSGDMTQIYQ